MAKKILGGLDAVFQAAEKRELRVEEEKKNFSKSTSMTFNIETFKKLKMFAVENDILIRDVIDEALTDFFKKHDR